MTVITSKTIAPVEPATRVRKPATQADIDALTSALTTVPTVPQKSEAEVRRERRLTDLDVKMTQFANHFLVLTEGASDLEAKASVLRSIKTIKSRLIVTLDSVPDEHLRDQSDETV